jgi:hypothetical protein
MMDIIGLRTRSTGVSMTIKSALADLVSVILWIDENGKVLDIEGNPRFQIAAACYDTALEHQAAIAALVEKEMYGSAHALLRVIAEAYFRGQWISRCATESELQRFQRDEQISKSLKTMVEEIESALKTSPGVLSAMVDVHWGSLCSFTHTGFRQVTRRYTGALLEPSYSEAEVIRSLNFAGAVGLLAMIELAALSKNEALANASLQRSKEFAAH